MDPATDWVVSGGYYALDFDGTNDVVTLPVTKMVANYATLSISAWIKRDATGARHAIWASGKSSGTSAVFVRIQNTDKIQYFEETGTYAISGATSLASAVWYHVCWTRTNSGVIIYLNGVVDAVDAGRAPATFTNDAADVIGAIWSAGALTNFYDGQMDDVRIYNRTLSQQEVLILSQHRRIAYETTHRRSYKAAAAPGGFKAAWLNQRSQIIGGGAR